MKSFTITESAQYTKKISSDILLSEYIRIPLRYGFTGFAFVLLVSTLMKYVGFLAGVIAEFEIGINEILLSLMGFVFIFLIRFLANFKSSLNEKVTEKKTYTSEAA